MGTTHIYLSTDRLPTCGVGSNAMTILADADSHCCQLRPTALFKDTTSTTGQGVSFPPSSSAITDRAATVSNCPLSRAPVNGLFGAYPSITDSMALQQPNHHRDLEEHVQETLGPHREVLEALAELDNELSDDAVRALAILDELETQE